MVVTCQVNDHILFFGSSGLVGSLTLKELLKLNLYLDGSTNIQKRFEGSNRLNLTSFRFNKFIYCINRRISSQDYSFDNEQSFENCKPVPVKLNNVDYYFEKFTPLSRPAGKCPGKSEADETHGKSGAFYVYNNSAGNLLKYHKTVREYRVDYRSECSKTLSITFNFVLLQIAFLDSSKWNELLPAIFSGSVAVRSEVGCQSTNSKLPPLDEIPTMICTLGAGGRQSKAKRHYVDYDLTFNLAQTFNNREGKRLIVVTTFNNRLIRHVLPYFRTKSKLEYDLQHRLKPRLKKLIVLRPGPLVGEHGSPHTKNLTIGHSGNALRQMLYYKQYCFQCKIALFREFRRTGFRTKASELIAKTMYRKPGSWVLGYCIPATKTAYVAAFKAVIESAEDNVESVEIITSEQMDQMVP